METLTPPPDYAPTFTPEFALSTLRSYPIDGDGMRLILPNLRARDRHEPGSLTVVPEYLDSSGTWRRFESFHHLAYAMECLSLL